MDIIRKLTRANLRLNKKRTIATMIAIALSCALILAVAGMAESGRLSLLGYTKKTQGDYHVMFEDVPAEKLSYVVNNVNVSSYFLERQEGWARLEENQNEYKPYLYLLSMTPEAMEKSGITLYAGRLPEKEGEIALPRHLDTSGGVYFHEGDELTLSVGRRETEDGQPLSQYDPMTEDEAEPGRILPEQIADAVDRTYTVVGFVDRPLFEEWSAPGFTCVTFLDPEKAAADGGTCNAAVRYRNARRFRQYTDEILRVLKEETGAEHNTVGNVDLLMFEGALSERTLQVLYSLAAFIIVIIIGTSIFVIRNSFVISVTEKQKQYGMLASIGATPKQIRKSVLLEGFYIGLLAIPAGIVIGIAAVLILTGVLNVIMARTDLSDIVFYYTVSPLAVAAAVILSCVTIWLSCLVPAIRAGKIPPVEAIRGNRTVKIRAKSLKTSPLIEKLFGVGGVIAAKNLRRSRSKYRTTVISLVVSIITFVTLSSFVDYGRASVAANYNDYDYNIYVSGENREQIEELKERLRPEHYSVQRVCTGYADSARISDEHYDLVESKWMGEEKPEEGRPFEEWNENNTIRIEITAFNREYFKEYARRCGVTSDLEHAVILADKNMVYQPKGGKELIRYTDLSAGDRFTWFLEEDVSASDENGEETVHFSEEHARSAVVSAIADPLPMGFEGTWYSSVICIFVSEDFLKDQPGMDEAAFNDKLLIRAEDPDEVEKALNELKLSADGFRSLYVRNLTLEMRTEKGIMTIVSIFLFGFIAVITAIGVTNIFNTITTNVLLRSKEFAMLRSVGMTNLEFGHMIRMESLLYGLRSLLIGLPAGILGSIAVWKTFGNEIDLGYLFPWKAILLSSIAVFLIVGLTMRHSIRKIKEQNIVETIRTDTI